MIFKTKINLVCILVIGIFATFAQAQNSKDCPLKPGEELALYWDSMQDYFGIQSDQKLSDRITLNGRESNVSEALAYFAFSANINWTEAESKGVRITTVKEFFMELSRDFTANDDFVKLRTITFPSTGVVGLGTAHEKTSTQVLLIPTFINESDQDKSVADARAIILNEIRSRFFRGKGCLAQWFPIKVNPPLVHF